MSPPFHCAVVRRVDSTAHAALHLLGRGLHLRGKWGRPGWMGVTKGSYQGLPPRSPRWKGADWRQEAPPRAAAGRTSGWNHVEGTCSFSLRLVAPRFSPCVLTAWQGGNATTSWPC